MQPLLIVVVTTTVSSGSLLKGLRMLGRKKYVAWNSLELAFELLYAFRSSSLTIGMKKVENMLTYTYTLA
jgi:hypothetical protein